MPFALTNPVKSPHKGCYARDDNLAESYCTTSFQIIQSHGLEALHDDPLLSHTYDPKTSDQDTWQVPCHQKGRFQLSFYRYLWTDECRSVTETWRGPADCPVVNDLAEIRRIVLVMISEIRWRFRHAWEQKGWTELFLISIFFSRTSILDVFIHCCFEIMPKKPTTKPSNYEKKKKKKTFPSPFPTMAA